MCWCLRVYWTVLHNLFVRFVTNVANLVYNNDGCDCCCCCCFCTSQKHKQTKHGRLDILNEIESPDESGLRAEQSTAYLQHDYVIVDEIDANYLEIERRKIETEPYYRTVDRITAEDILTCREDGACLVRPYKETVGPDFIKDISIKYIVSIYAQQQYFHLFIRQICGKERYGIGQEKTNERLFTTPSDIIDFHSYNALQCTNKNQTISLLLKPIIA